MVEVYVFCSNIALIIRQSISYVYIYIFFILSTLTYQIEIDISKYMHAIGSISVIQTHKEGVGLR